MPVFIAGFFCLLNALPGAVAGNAHGDGDTDLQNQTCLDCRPLTVEDSALVQSRLQIRDRTLSHSRSVGSHEVLDLVPAIAPYKDSALASITPKSTRQLELIERSILNHMGVDAWSEVMGVNITTMFLLTKDRMPGVKKVVREAGMELSVLIPDVAEKLQDEHNTNLIQASRGVVGSYPTLDELYRWYDSIASQHKSVEVFSIGATHESRDIKVVKIARRPGLPMVLVECGTHAREWISTAACVWMINELLTSSDPNTKDLTDNIEFQIIPSVNPDGYQWTHAGARLWRKNRNPNGGHWCKGVDLNRNWNSNWETVDTSHDKCSGMYVGTQPFSEPETQALSKHMLRERGRIKAFLAFHSFGQLMLLPPASGPNPPDISKLQAVGEEAAQRMKQIAGQIYEVGTQKDVLYASSGSSLDWAHDSEKGPGIEYTFLLELRPAMYSPEAFQLPIRQIPQASEEAFACLKYVAQVVAKGASALRLSDIERASIPSPRPAAAPNHPDASNIADLALGKYELGAQQIVGDRRL